MTSLEQALGTLRSLRGAAPQGEGGAAVANGGEGFALMIATIEHDARDPSGRGPAPAPEAPEPRPSSAAGIGVVLSPCFYPYAVSTVSTASTVAPAQTPSLGLQLPSIAQASEPASLGGDAVAAEGAAPVGLDEKLIKRADHASKGAKYAAACGTTAQGLPLPSEEGEAKLAARGAAADFVIPAQTRREPPSLAEPTVSSSSTIQSDAPTIRVNELATHLPVALDRVVTQMLSPASDDHPVFTRHVSAPAPERQEALKILKFDVEPAAMGPISVRMKITQSGIEIRMDARSAAAPALMEAREALSSAIGDKGLTLDAYEVRVLPVAPQSVTAPDSPAENRGNFERGFANDDGSNQQERRSDGRRATPPQEEPPSSFVPRGLVL